MAGLSIKAGILAIRSLSYEGRAVYQTMVKLLEDGKDDECTASMLADLLKISPERVRKAWNEMAELGYLSLGEDDTDICQASELCLDDLVIRASIVKTLFDEPKGGASKATAATTPHRLQSGQDEIIIGNVKVMAFVREYEDEDSVFSLDVTELDLASKAVRVIAADMEFPSIEEAWAWFDGYVEAKEGHQPEPFEEWLQGLECQPVEAENADVIYLDADTFKLVLTGLTEAAAKHESATPEGLTQVAERIANAEESKRIDIDGALYIEAGDGWRWPGLDDQGLIEPPQIIDWVAAQERVDCEPLSLDPDSFRALVAALVAVAKTTLEGEPLAAEIGNLASYGDDGFLPDLNINVTEDGLRWPGLPVPTEEDLLWMAEGTGGNIIAWAKRQEASEDKGPNGEPIVYVTPATFDALVSVCEEGYDEFDPTLTGPAIDFKAVRENGELFWEGRGYYSAAGGADHSVTAQDDASEEAALGVKEFTVNVDADIPILVRMDPTKGSGWVQFTFTGPICDAGEMSKNARPKEFGEDPEGWAHSFALEQREKFLAQGAGS